MPTALLIYMAVLSAVTLLGLIAVARSRGRVFELIDVQAADNRLHVLAYERCDSHVQSLSLIGSVTTWRDLDGNEIRDRNLIEWLYTQWLAHKRLCVA